jgi:hypothetical protein
MPDSVGQGLAVTQSAYHHRRRNSTFSEVVSNLPPSYPSWRSQQEAAACLILAVVPENAGEAVRHNTTVDPCAQLFQVTPGHTQTSTAYAYRDPAIQEGEPTLLPFPHQTSMSQLLEFIQQNIDQFKGFVAADTLLPLRPPCLGLASALCLGLASALCPPRPCIALLEEYSRISLSQMPHIFAKYGSC